MNAAKPVFDGQTVFKKKTPENLQKRTLQWNLTLYV